jgi:predicted glycoside hydrolase/deacetylase ChbG (UPF0249 family)
VFDLSLPRHSLWLGREDRDAVREELQAQWQRCVEHGVRPSHIDSHQHVHNIWPIGEIVARFAAQQGVPIRLARNLGQNLSLPKRVFKGCSIGVCRVWPARRRTTYARQWTCSNAPAPSDGVLEIVAHPNQLDSDFGDAYLNPGESLNRVLEQRLTGVPRCPMPI